MAEATAEIRFKASDNGFSDTIERGVKAMTGLFKSSDAVAAGLGRVQKVAGGTASQVALGSEQAEKLAANLGKVGVQGLKVATTFSNFLDIKGYFDIAAKGVAGIAASLDRLPQTTALGEAIGVDTSSIQQFQQLGEALKFNQQELDSFAISAVARLTQFEESLTRVGTILRSDTRMDGLGNSARANTEELQKNGGAVQDLVNGPLKNAVTSTSALAGQYEVLSGGFTDANSSRQVLEAGLKLSVVGQAESGSTLRLLVKTLQAYKLEAGDAGRVASVLNGIVDQGITTVPELTNNFGQTATVAKEAGVKLEELGGAVAVLTTKGTTTDTALTGIESLSRIIIDKTPQAAAALANLRDESGKPIKFDIAEIKAKGLVKALQDLNKATGGNAQALANIIPESLAYSTALGLMANNAKDFEAVTVKLGQNTSKSLEEVFGISLGNRAKDFERIVNKFGELLIKIGQGVAPSFQGAIDFLDNLATAFNSLPEPIKVGIGQLVAAQIATRAFMGAGQAAIATIFDLGKAYLTNRVIALAFTGQLGQELEVMKALIQQRKGLLAVGLQAFGFDQRSRLSVTETTAALLQQTEKTTVLGKAKEQFSKLFTKENAETAKNTAATVANTAVTTASAIAEKAMNSELGKKAQNLASNNSLLQKAAEAAQAFKDKATQKLDDFIGGGGKSPVDKAKETASQVAEQGKQIAQDVAAQAQSVAQDAVKQGQQAAEQVTQKVQDTVGRAKQVVRDRASDGIITIDVEAVPVVDDRKALPQPKQSLPVEIEPVAMKPLALPPAKNAQDMTSALVVQSTAIEAQSLATTKATTSQLAKNTVTAQGAIAEGAETAAIAQNTTAKTVNQVAESNLIKTRLFGKEVAFASTGIFGGLNKLLLTEIPLRQLLTTQIAANTTALAANNAASKGVAIAKGIATGAMGLFSGAASGATAAMGALWVAAGPVIIAAGALAAAGALLFDQFFGASAEARKYAKSLDGVLAQDDKLRKSFNQTVEVQKENRSFFGDLGKAIAGVGNNIDSFAEKTPGLNLIKGFGDFIVGIPENYDAMNRQMPAIEAFGKVTDRTYDKIIDTTKANQSLSKGYLLTEETNAKLRAGMSLTVDDMSKEQQVFEQRKKVNDEYLSGLEQAIQKEKDPGRQAALQAQIEKLKDQTSALKDNFEANKKYIEQQEKLKQTLILNANVATTPGTQGGNPVQTSLNKQLQAAEVALKDHQSSVNKNLQEDQDKLRADSSAYQEAVLAAFSQDAITAEDAIAKLKLALDDTVTVGNVTGSYLDPEQRIAGLKQIAELQAKATERDNAAINVEIEKSKTLGQAKVKTAEETETKVIQLELQSDRNRLGLIGKQIATYQEGNLRRVELEQQASILRTQIQAKEFAQSDRLTENQFKKQQEQASINTVRLQIRRAQGRISEQGLADETFKIQQDLNLKQQEMLQKQIDARKAKNFEAKDLEKELARVQLEQQKAAAEQEQRLFERRIEQRKQAIANLAAMQIQQLERQASGIDTRSKEIQLTQELKDSRNGVAQAEASAQESQIQNQIRLTKDSEKRAGLEVGLAETRLANLARSQAFEQESLKTQAQIKQLEIDREIIQNRIAQVENQRNIATTQLEIIRAKRDGKSAEELEALNLQLSALQQQGSLNIQQSQFLEKSKQQQSEIAVNAERRLAIEQQVARAGGEVDIRLAQQALAEEQRNKALERRLKLLERQQQQTENYAREVELQGQVEQGRADTLSKAAERQNQLLEQRKAIAQSVSNLTQGELQIAIDTETNETRRAKLSETVAAIRLQSARQQQELERQSLELQIQQNQAALEREKIQNRIGKANNLAQLASAQAELARVQSDKAATPEQVRAAQLGIQARLEEGAALEVGAAQLDVQGRLNTQDAASQRQRLANEQTLAEDQARLDLAQNIRRPRDRKRALRNLRDESLASVTGGLTGRNAIGQLEQFNRAIVAQEFGVGAGATSSLNLLPAIAPNQAAATSVDFDTIRKNFLARMQEFVVPTPTIQAPSLKAPGVGGAPAGASSGAAAIATGEQSVTIQVGGISIVNQFTGADVDQGKAASQTEQGVRKALSGILDKAEQSGRSRGRF
ncbi:MAG: phage tail tape measure protein [Trichocoleus desertorum ATA4-8-CV12]|jgi:hypothetical protein|nr:phage tail tape measure protein [Trichocoleus desertorum ATA4-8-CV12]